MSPPLSARKRGRASRSCARARTRRDRSPRARHAAARSTTRLAEMDAGREDAVPAVEGSLRRSCSGSSASSPSRSRRTAAGTALRRHQVDALAGMLTELIAASQRYDESNGNGNGNGHAATAEELEQQEVEDEDEDSTLVVEIEDAELPEEPAAGRPRRRAPLPLPPPDRVGQDDRRRRLRRGRPHARRPDPHAPPPARLPVHARPDDRGLRRAPHRRDHDRRHAARSRRRSRSRPTPGSRATSTRSTATRTSS